MVRWDRAVALLIAGCLAGCVTLGPDYKRPSAELPEQWAPTADAVQLPAKWWMVYDDARLNALVEQALGANRDLAAAAARVDVARANLTIVNADRYPQVAAEATRSRTRLSNRGAIAYPPGTRLESNATRVQLGASFEIDFWGKFRRASEAARADLLAQEASREAILLSLTADVVRRYYALTSLDAQVAIIERTLATRESTVSLETQRLEGGVVSELELRRAEAERDAVRSQRAALERSREEERGALAVLLGSSPREVLRATVANRASWDGGNLAEGPPVVIPSELPSALLERRPDVREAEQRLVAANARIGAVRAAYFPSIGLTGYLGSESASLADLFTGPAGIWQFAAALTQPLFTGGRATGDVAAAKAREREALARYERTIQQSFADVRAALAGQATARTTFDAESDRARALVRALALARDRYINGVASQLEVLDAERNLLAAERARVDALANQHTAIADVAIALGGGWAPPKEP